MPQTQTNAHVYVWIVVLISWKQPSWKQPQTTNIPDVLEDT